MTYLNKGLLLTVVLCCLFYSCTSVITVDSQPSNTTVTTWDSTIPNPTKYFLFGSGQPTNQQSDTLSNEEYALLKDGDVLLRRGRGAISDYIVDFLQEKYPVTHCAFIINSQHEQPMVLHTISNKETNGMLIEPLTNYLKQSQANSLVAIRLKASEAQIQLVLEEAQQLLQQQIPFDMKFDDQDKQSLYCIEMMRNVFLTVFQIDWLPKRTNKNTINVLSMDNFFDTLHFKPIFNHFEHSNNRSQ